MYTELERSANTLAQALAANDVALAKAGVVRDIRVSVAAHTSTSYLDFFVPKGLSAHQQLLVASAQQKLLLLMDELHGHMEAALPSLGPLTWSLQTTRPSEGKTGFLLDLWGWKTPHASHKKVGQRLRTVAERMQPVRTGLRTFCVQPNQKTSWNLRAHAPEDALLAWHVMRFATIAPTFARMETVQAEVVETYHRHRVLAGLRAHHFPE
jgi:hypothetical protein